MTIESIAKVLSHLSSTSVIIPFISCLINYKAFNKQLKALFIYLCFSILSELVGLLSLKYPFFGTPGSYLFSIIETSIIMYLFSSEMKQTIWRKSIRMIYVIFISSSTISLIIKNIQFAEEVTLPIEFASVLILSVIYFYKIFTDLTIPKLINYPFFWFNSAFLLYFGTNFLLFLFYTYIKISDMNLIYLAGCIPLIMSIIYNSLLAVGICKIKRV